METVCQRLLALVWCTEVERISVYNFDEYPEIYPTPSAHIVRDCCHYTKWSIQKRYICKESFKSAYVSSSKQDKLSDPRGPKLWILSHLTLLCRVFQLSSEKSHDISQIYGSHPASNRGYYIGVQNSHRHFTQVIEASLGRTHLFFEIQLWCRSSWLQETNRRRLSILQLVVSWLGI